MVDTDHPLRIWRQKHGMTLAQLADTLDVSASHLSEIERGRNKPSLKLALRLSKATEWEIGVAEFVRSP